MLLLVTESMTHQTGNGDGMEKASFLTGDTVRK